MPRAGVGNDGATGSTAASVPVVGCRPRRRPEALAALSCGNRRQSKHGAGVRIDKMDLGEIPDGEAHSQQGEMPVAVGNLEAAPLDDGGAVTLAKGSPL